MSDATTPTSEIVRLYAEGRHLREIGKIIGRSHEAVRLRLLSAGVVLRPRSEEGKKGRGRLGVEKAALMAEIVADLPRFPNGATVADLAGWLGSPMAEISGSVHALFLRGRIRISLTDGPA